MFIVSCIKDFFEERKQNVTMSQAREAKRRYREESHEKASTLSAKSSDTEHTKAE